MSKNDFIKNIADIVVKENEKRGYPLFSSVVIAQACLETGYGNSSLMMKANAVFGIKATKNWKGLVYNAKTKECYNGINFVSINDCFRAYLSIVDSVADYFDLITKSERYRKACIAETAFECITAIKNGGYATDPNYVEKIMNIIRNNDLIAKYDEKIDVVESNLDELVQKTLKGEFGNGEERKKNLGSYYNVVMAKINSLYGKTVKKI